MSDFGVCTGATSTEKKTLPPLKNKNFTNKEFYVTVLFSTISRSELVDPHDAIDRPHQVFNKVHNMNKVLWENGTMTFWEPGQVSKQLKKQDKVIYVDCSNVMIDKFLNFSFPNYKALLTRFVGVVECIKDFMNLQYVRGYKGRIHFNLGGLSPFDQMMYALWYLIKSTESTPNIPDKDKCYKEFTTLVLKKFQNTFERYTNSGYSMTVDYCCAFENYLLYAHQMTYNDLLIKIDDYRAYAAFLADHNNPENGRRMLDYHDCYAYFWTTREERDCEVSYNEKCVFFKNYDYPPNTAEYNRGQQIYYHGNLFYHDELMDLYHKTLKYYGELKKKDRSDAIDNWLNKSKAQREWEEFEPIWKNNYEVGNRNQLLINENNERKKMLDYQMNPEKADQDAWNANTQEEKDQAELNKSYREAYDLGLQIHSEDGNLEDYHDVNQMNFDAMYVDYDVLDSRERRYKRRITETEADSVEKWEEMEDRVFWYPVKVCWTIIRIGVAIGTFFKPVFIFVDMGFEAVEIGVKYANKKEDEDIDIGQNLFSIGVDLFCIWAMRGGPARILGPLKAMEAPVRATAKERNAAKLANEVKDGKVVTNPRGLSPEEINNAKMDEIYKVSSEEVEASFEIGAREQGLRHAQSATAKPQNPKDPYDKGGYLYADMNQAKDDLMNYNKLHALYPDTWTKSTKQVLQERVFYKEQLYKDAVAESTKQRNELSYFVYDNLRGKSTISIKEYYHDVRLYASNWKQLQLNKKIVVGALLTKDAFGNGYAIGGIANNSVIIVQ